MSLRPKAGLHVYHLVASPHRPAFLRQQLSVLKDYLSSFFNSPVNEKKENKEEDMTAPKGWRFIMDMREPKRKRYPEESGLDLASRLSRLVT